MMEVDVGDVGRVVELYLRQAQTVIAEAALSFLGLSVPPSITSWGGMMAEGRTYLVVAWWLATIPGIAISLTVIGVNLFGDWLRDYLDAKLRV